MPHRCPFGDPTVAVGSWELTPPLPLHSTPYLLHGAVDSCAEFKPLEASQPSCLILQVFRLCMPVQSCTPCPQKKFPLTVRYLYFSTLIRSSFYIPHTPALSFSPPPPLSLPLYLVSSPPGLLPALSAAVFQSLMPLFPIVLCLSDCVGPS